MRGLGKSLALSDRRGGPHAGGDLRTHYPRRPGSGAAWAGVVAYIDRQLTGPYRKLQKTYGGGIAGTNATAVKMFGAPFAALNAHSQDAVLTAMEKGDAPTDCWKGLAAKRFFDLVVTHTLQGFYGDPRHGGNRDRASWKMLRLPYPPVRGRVG